MSAPNNNPPPPDAPDARASRSADLVGPVVPRPPARRDKVLPILIVASLVVHGTIMLPSLLGRGDATPPPREEIPVEIVQLPPKPAEKKPVERKPVEKTKVAEKPKASEKPKAAETPKPPEKKVAKAEQPKPAPKPPKVAQKPPPKPVPQKVAAKQPARPEPSPKPTNVAARLRDLLGPMPAVALPGTSADGTDEVSYSQLVLSKVAKAKKEGRYPGTPGAASVAFTIGDSGEVSSVAIVRPSGIPSLDDEAVAMIKRGAPYPPPPPGGRRDYAITLRFEPLI